MHSSKRRMTKMVNNQKPNRKIDMFKDALVNSFWIAMTLCIIVFPLVIGFKESQRETNKKNQCTTACHPYAVTSSEDKYCLCANTSTILWRKDIK